MIVSAVQTIVCSSLNINRSVSHYTFLVLIIIKNGTKLQSFKGITLRAPICKGAW